jgi:HD-GYP domain-containing protein (c-di-GMP phosphodiesterase class II)
MKKAKTDIHLKSVEQIQSNSELSQTIERLFQRHKNRLLKASYLYSSLNYSKLVSEEIMRHERDENVDEKVFLKNKTLTRETLSQLFRIQLRNPIERYLKLKRPLTAEGLSADVNRYGKTLFSQSKVRFLKIKDRLEKMVLPLNGKTLLLNQLAILKTENQKKYKDMLMTGLLNYAIESRFTTDEHRLEMVFLAGIFHDIGFVVLDPKYHDLSSTDFTIHDLKKIQSHTEVGYHVLKAHLKNEIANAAMNHHIGEDNSGYPRKVFSQPDRISKLTGFTSAFIACLRKHSLKNALKIQDIYSRDKSYFGEALTPFFKREFYDTLIDLDLQYNKTGQNIDIKFNRKYSVVLHNFLVYIFDLCHELKKIDQLLLNYTWKKSHRLELQGDIDDVFDHINKLNIIMKSCGKSPGLRQIMQNNTLASQILGDIEIISMELHRNNEFLSGLFSFLNTKSADFSFENSVYKKSLEFSDNIKRNISDQLEKEVSVFNMLSSISG